MTSQSSASPPDGAAAGSRFFSPRLRAGSPEAARQVWDWKNKTKVDTSHGYSRASAIPGAIIGSAAGGLILWWGHELMARIVWGITAFLVLTALVSPNGLYALIRRGLDRFGIFVGRFLAWVLLTPLYMLFFFPYGRIMRRGRRDGMRRWLDKDAPTYWTDRNDPDRTPEFYERQF